MQEQQDPQETKEKAAVDASATAMPTPEEQNVCADNDSTSPAESQVPAQGRSDEKCEFFAQDLT